MYRKNGPPNSAVTDPTGRLTAEIPWEMQSASSVTSAPMAADAGRRMRMSDPMIILHTCGAMSPTKPIGPVKLTDVAVMSETITRTTRRPFHGSTPSVVAWRSPIERMPMRLDEAKIAAIATAAATATTPTLSHVALPRVPTLQE